MYRGLYRTAYARVSRGVVTDTELQIGQFVVPKRGFEPTSQSKESRLSRSWKEGLPEDHVRKPVSASIFPSTLTVVVSVVSNGILRQSATRGCKWSLLPCVQYCEFHP